MSLSMASMAARAGNPADLTSEPIPHGVTSCLGLPVTDCLHAVWSLWSPPLTRKGRSVGNSTLRLGTAYSHLPPRDGCVRMPPLLSRLVPHSSSMEARETDSSNEYWHAGAVLYQGFCIATGHSVHLT